MKILKSYRDPFNPFNNNTTQLEAYNLMNMHILIKSSMCAAGYMGHITNKANNFNS